MRREKEQEVVEITQDVRIGDFLLEAGDKIVVLNEKSIKIGSKVKVLNGKYKGKVGVVDDIEDDQYNVKMDDGQVRYLDVEDLEVQ